VPTSARFVFEPFELDPVRRRLTASGEPVVISDRLLSVLLLLVARAGHVVSKDDLITAGWSDVAVGDNSLEQAISNLRRVLGAGYIETAPRRGYRFGAVVERKAHRESDADLDDLLAPYRAFVEGRAALETLGTAQVTRAREVFEGALTSAPEHASSHLGLANACVMQFEMTRADPAPDTAALALAIAHAREACRLDPLLAEAWATLGFVLDRTGDRLDALAAVRRAITLEPDNWRHHFRAAVVGWGEERLRAAQRTLSLLPGFPLAHWLAATVHVARQAFGEAERDLTAGLASQGDANQPGSQFSAVALHWLRGLLFLRQGDEPRARAEFDRELSFEQAGHLYARECAANTWYAIGALHLRRNRQADAIGAFTQAIERVPSHRLARVGLAAAGVRAESPGTGEGRLGAGASVVDVAIARAVSLVLTGADAEAARLVDEALAVAQPGSAGWLLPIEPLLDVSTHTDVWVSALARLRGRAS
jgi:DNA-binding winged helix-turn-helix (wHTH) protein